MMKRLSASVLAAALLLAGCGGAQPAAPAAGGDTTPKPAAEAPAPKIDKLTIGFVPSQEAGGIADKVKPMEDFLTKELGIPVKATVGTNFIAVVEAMGSKQVDVGFLNPFSYVLASGDHKVQVILKSQRKGASSYRAQMVTRTEDNIPACKDGDTKCTATFEALKGKKVAFVDAASTSGYLFPASFMKEAGISLDKGKFFAETIFAGAHDNAAKAVLNKTVDAAWSFEDVRDNLVKEFPNVKEQLKVVAYTTPIPNDTVSVRDGLPADMVAKIKAAMLKFAGTEEGKKVLKDLYTIDGFVDAADKDYDVIRAMAKNMGIDVKAELSKPKK